MQIRNKIRDNLIDVAIGELVFKYLHEPEKMADEIIAKSSDKIEYVFSTVPKTEITKRALKRAKKDYLSRLLARFISRLQEILQC